jgi:hypothetical protein
MLLIPCAQLILVERSREVPGAPDDLLIIQRLRPRSKLCNLLVNLPSVLLEQRTELARLPASSVASSTVPGIDNAEPSARRRNSRMDGESPVCVADGVAEGQLRAQSPRSNPIAK